MLRVAGAAAAAGRAPPPPPAAGGCGGALARRSRLAPRPERAWRGLAAPSGPAGAAGASCPGGGERRRRAWATSLSPLERVQRLLAPEAAAGAGRGPLREGELALVELGRRQRGALKLLCRLAAGAALATPGGLLPHDELLGRLPGQVVRAAGGRRLLVRRPSLEEYVLLMARGAAIAYPKDVSAMLMMMDLHPGDSVLESGSGSGALSLFLSRAVGSKGHVLSYDIREDHHNLAKKNYRQWRASWEIGHMEEWPDNVDFVLKDITTAAEDMKSVTFDAIVLDMLNPQAALPVIYPSLKHGGVCAVYLANITQVIALLDRIRTCKLPFLCERIIDVTHRNWLVLPAKMKNCKSIQIAETQENIEEEPQQKEHEEIHFKDQVVLKETEDDESLSDNVETYSSVPYTARPSYWQEAHSAFLTKLRKFQPPLS